MILNVQSAKSAAWSSAEHFKAIQGNIKTSDCAFVLRLDVELAKIQGPYAQIGIFAARDAEASWNAQRSNRLFVQFIDVYKFLAMVVNRVKLA